MKKKILGHIDGRSIKEFARDQERRHAITRPAMTICNMVESKQIEQAATICLIGDDVTQTGRADLIVLGLMIGARLTAAECKALAEALLV